jgi:hypothetical protein
MSLPAKEDHVCVNCTKTRGISCNRKREVKEGYCTDFVLFEGCPSDRSYCDDSMGNGVCPNDKLCYGGK